MKIIRYCVWAILLASTFIPMHEYGHCLSGQYLEPVLDKYSKNQGETCTIHIAPLGEYHHEDKWASTHFPNETQQLQSWEHPMIYSFQAMIYLTVGYFMLVKDDS